ncbi:MAG: phytanoyl-CoA dioxygenase family protein [Spirochaetaceae bacterium]|nr:phytanoyl-CoA dioxygenase family protein [Spirochaetaceae bacterium]
MSEITPSAAEHAAGRFEAAAVQHAIAALRKDGFLVINDIVEHDHLDRLRERMTGDLDTIRGLPAVPHNFVWGNIQQNPPPDAGLVFRDVVANPFVCQITRELLGPGAFNDYLSGNTNIPGSGLQPVHVDDGQLWPDLQMAHPPARLVVNVALGDTTAENGAIELWPGTHLDTSMAIGTDTKVPKEQVAARRAVRGPVQGSTSKGSMLIRDMRLWHRGTPNRSAGTRFMIAMIHSVAWYRRTRRFELEEACAPVFAGCPIENAIPLVANPGNHLTGNDPYDYAGPD